MLYYKIENDAHITHTQRCTLQIYLASKNFICNFPFYTLHQQQINAHFCSLISFAKMWKFKKKMAISVSSEWKTKWAKVENGWLLLSTLMVNISQGLSHTHFSIHWGKKKKKKRRMQLTDFGFLFSLRFAFYKLHISLHLRLKPRRPKSPRVLTVWLATFVTFLLPVCLLYFLISWPTFASWQLQFQLVSSGAPSSFVAVVGAGHPCGWICIWQVTAVHCTKKCWNRTLLGS